MPCLDDEIEALSATINQCFHHHCTHKCECHAVSSVYVLCGAVPTLIPCMPGGCEIRWSKPRVLLFMPQVVLVMGS